MVMCTRGKIRHGGMWEFVADTFVGGVECRCVNGRVLFGGGLRLRDEGVRGGGIGGLEESDGREMGGWGKGLA